MAAGRAGLTTASLYMDDIPAFDIGRRGGGEPRAALKDNAKGGRLATQCRYEGQSRVISGAAGAYRAGGRTFPSGVASHWTGTSKQQRADGIRYGCVYCGGDGM